MGNAKDNAYDNNTQEIVNQDEKDIMVLFRISI